jgi:hypothetical protein
MANMEIEITQFLAANELDAGLKEATIDLVNKCFTIYITHMSSQWLTAAPPAAPKKAVSKVEKSEDPTECESETKLNMRCTTAVLDEYCRTHKLRIGGEGGKAARVSRVWRHMQGESDADDFSPRNKPKNTPAKKEPKKCSCKTAKGAPCAAAATNERDGHWFCYKHIDQADDFIAVLGAEDQQETPVSSPAKKPVVKRPSAAIKKAKAPEPEEELEEEADEE